MSEIKNIPFFNYSHVFTSEEKNLIRIFSEVGRRGAFIMQQDLADFEKKLAAYTGAKYAVGVANATDGLQMAMLAANIGSGDEIIFCSHTMVATAASIYFTGATPVPVEAGSDHLINPDAIEAVVTPRTRAIVPTQLNGRTTNMDAIQAIADKHDLIIFEDAAQALGSKFKERCAGTFGIASCISFYPAKILGCLGDGGAVLTSDEDIYRKLLLLRDHGRDDDGDVVLWGFNSRLDNLQAAILSERLKSYEQVIERRRAIAEIYQKKIGQIGQLGLPPSPNSEPDHFDVFQNYEIEADNRNQLQAHLRERGIGTLIQWGGKGVHEFRKLGFTQSLPFTEKLTGRLLMLPMNMSLSNEDVSYICDHITDFYQSS
jgi:dTDP-4-amino-4,6-dideoxygalactose transaminase